jgi:hypothetical protein
VRGRRAERREERGGGDRNEIGAPTRRVLAATRLRARRSPPNRQPQAVGSGGDEEWPTVGDERVSPRPPGWTPGSTRVDPAAKRHSGSSGLHQENGLCLLATSSVVSTAQPKLRWRSARFRYFGDEEFRRPNATLCCRGVRSLPQARDKTVSQEEPSQGRNLAPRCTIPSLSLRLKAKRELCPIAGSRERDRISLPSTCDGHSVTSSAPGGRLYPRVVRRLSWLEHKWRRSRA